MDVEQPDCDKILGDLKDLWGLEKIINEAKRIDFIEDGYSNMMPLFTIPDWDKFEEVTSDIPSSQRGVNNKKHFLLSESVRAKTISETSPDARDEFGVLRNTFNQGYPVAEPICGVHALSDNRDYYCEENLPSFFSGAKSDVLRDDKIEVALKLEAFGKFFHDLKSKGYQYEEHFKKYEEHLLLRKRASAYEVVLTDVFRAHFSELHHPSRPFGMDYIHEILSLAQEFDELKIPFRRSIFGIKALSWNSEETKFIESSMRKIIKGSFEKGYGEKYFDDEGQLFLKK